MGWGRRCTACWSGTDLSLPATLPTCCIGCSRGIFPAPRRLRRSIDPKLEAICLKAMALKPEDRHATPLALAGEIEVWLAEVSYRSEQERALHEVKRSLAASASSERRTFSRGTCPARGCSGWRVRWRTSRRTRRGSSGLSARAWAAGIRGRSWWSVRFRTATRSMPLPSAPTGGCWRPRARTRWCGSGTLPREGCSHRRFATRRRSGRSRSARTGDLWPRRAMTER